MGVGESRESFFWRDLKAVQQNLAAWVVLFFSMGVKALVNQVEQPFARSLVTCETPTELDSYTGSRWCGDRLEVIQSGMYLSAMGQGQENFAMLCSLTFVIIMTGVYGPRLPLALGLLGVTTSVVLFVVASSSPDIGRRLFAMGQGLQGLYPIEYLLGILMLHMSMLPGADGEAYFRIMSYMGILSNIVWNMMLGNGVQMLELTYYGHIWTVILGINATILLLAIFAFPAMKPMDSDRHQGKSAFMKVVHEVLSYKDLIYDWRARRYLTKMVFENVIIAFHGTVLPGALMAYHNWSQQALVFFFMLPGILELFAVPFYKSLLVSRFGYFQTYVGTVRFMIVGQNIAVLSILFTDKLLPIFILIRSLLAGFNPLKGFVDSRFSDPVHMQRFASVQWVMGYFLGMWTGPMFASRFNAGGQTAWERSTPFVLFTAWCVGQYWSVFHLIYDMDGVHGFAVTVKVLDELEDKGTKLWQIVALQQGLYASGHIDEEKWRTYSLDVILGKQIWEVGGPIMNFDQWKAIIGAMNPTSADGAALVLRLDAAIAHSLTVQKGFLEAVSQFGGGGSYPELEGTWLPIRGEEWSSPHEGDHPNTKEVWDGAGNCQFENGDWDAGTLRVLSKHGDTYFLQYKLLKGAAAPLEGNLIMRTQEDGTRKFEAPVRYLRKADGAMAPGADEPAPEGKKAA